MQTMIRKCEKIGLIFINQKQKMKWLTNGVIKIKVFLSPNHKDQI